MHVLSPTGVRYPVYTLDFETFYAPYFTLSKQTTTTYVRSPQFRAHGASLIYPDEEKAVWISHCELNDVLRSIDWRNAALLCHNTAFDGLILSHHFGQVAGYYLDTASMSRGEFGVHVPHRLKDLAIRLDIGRKIEGTLEKTEGLRKFPWSLERELMVYANMDAELTLAAFRTLYYEYGYPERELHIIDATIRAYVDPVLVIDTQLCEEELEDEVRKQNKAIERAGVPLRSLRSNQQFAALLEANGVEPPTKISLTTGEPTYAFAKTDVAFTALLRDDRVADLVAARLACKTSINITRAQRFLEHAHPRFPVSLIYCGAHTHRWTAGDKTNLQNLPAARKGQSTRLRRSLLAPEGHVLVVADSSQIEARVLAWMAGQEDMLDVFRSGGDPYAHMAEAIYGHPVRKGVVITRDGLYWNGEDFTNIPYWEAQIFEKDDAKLLAAELDATLDATLSFERNVGKVAVLGLGYGMGAQKFHDAAASQGIDLDPETCQHIVRIYRNRHAAIVSFWGRLEAMLGNMRRGEEATLGPCTFREGRVQMPNGLNIYYPNLTVDETEYGMAYRYYSRNGWVYLYGGKLCENLIQSIARTVVAEQILKVSERYRIISMVHDEVIYLAPEQEAAAALDFGIQCLSTAPEWCGSLPVAAEGGYARNYSK